MIFRGLLRLLSSALDRQSHESVPYSSVLLIKSVLSSHSRRGTYESTHSWPSPLGKELSSVSMLPCSEIQSMDGTTTKGPEVRAVCEPHALRKVWVKGVVYLGRDTQRHGCVHEYYVKVASK